MIKNTRKLNLYLTTGQGTKAERAIARKEGLENKNGLTREQAYAATPAIALCTAALRARTTLASENPHG